MEKTMLLGCQKRKMRMVNVVIIIVMLLFITLSSSFAGGRRFPTYINVGDSYCGIFYHQYGAQMIVYPYYLTSNSLWDANGEKVDFDIRGEGLLYRPIYARMESEKVTWFPNAVISSGRVSVKNPATGEWETSVGMGDALFAPTTFIELDKKNRWGLQVDCLVYLPFGDYQKGRLANLGTNQYSLEPLLILNKGWRLGSKELFTETSAHYLYNGENRDEQFKPGDMTQFSANLGLMTGKFTVGLSARHAASVHEDETYGNKVANSKVKITEIGSSVSYQISPKCNLYVRVMEAVDGENTPKTTLIMGKIWFPF